MTGFISVAFSIYANHITGDSIFTTNPRISISLNGDREIRGSTAGETLEIVKQNNIISRSGTEQQQEERIDRSRMII